MSFSAQIGTLRGIYGRNTKFSIKIWLLFASMSLHHVGACGFWFATIRRSNSTTAVASGWFTTFFNSFGIRN